MEIYTIGFTQTSAERFFGRLRKAGVKRLIDVRLNNISQLAGFAKRDDLAYFLRELCGVDYRHEPLLAPTQVLLDDLKKRGGQWAEYECGFNALLRARRVEQTVDRKLLDVRSVLLCSEAKPDQCHRRLAAEYLAKRWDIDRIIHL